MSGIPNREICGERAIIRTVLIDIRIHPHTIKQVQFLIHFILFELFSLGECKGEGDQGATETTCRVQRVRRVRLSSYSPYVS